jgi:hypothetical protein
MSEALFLNSSLDGNFKRIIFLLATNLSTAPFIPPYLSSVGLPWVWASSYSNIASQGVSDLAVLQLGTCEVAFLTVSRWDNNKQEKTVI